MAKKARSELTCQSRVVSESYGSEGAAIGFEGSLRFRTSEVAGTASLRRSRRHVLAHRDPDNEGIYLPSISNSVFKDRLTTDVSLGAQKALHASSAVM